MYTIHAIDFCRTALHYLLIKLLNLKSIESSPPYKSLMLPTGRCKARPPILSFEKVHIRTNESRWRLPDEPERHSRS
jgi:hypothetical protein